MENDAGQIVDLYVPRKCSATNRPIGARDHAAVQINVGEVNEAGLLVAGKCKTYALSGYVRAQGEADDSMVRLAQADKIVHKVFNC